MDSKGVGTRRLLTRAPTTFSQWGDPASIHSSHRHHPIDECSPFSKTFNLR